MLIFQVVPELLTLNRLPSYLLLPIMAPLLALACSTGSALSPAYVYALGYVGNTGVSQFAHLCGPLFGAIVAGGVMSRAFPPNDKEQEFVEFYRR